MKVLREPWTWIVALMLVLLATQAWSQPYQFTDLGNSIPRAGNNHRQLVGASSFADFIPYIATLWIGRLLP